MDPVILSCDAQIQKRVHRLGVLILLWRRQYCMTQLELSKRTGILQSYISSIENGTVDPRLSTLLKLLQGFDDMSLHTFLNGPDDEEDSLPYEFDGHIDFH